MNTIKRLAVPTSLTPQLTFGFAQFRGTCPDCGAYLSARTEEHAAQLVAAHVCAPEDVRTTAVVWTHNPGEDIAVLWGLDVNSEIITVSAAACGYCREYGPFGDICPGPVAHAMRQLDQETQIHGHTAFAALVATPAAFPEDMLQAEILERITRGTLQSLGLEPVRADRTLRTVLGKTGTQHVAYCPECATTCPERDTAAEAARDIETHRCDPERVRAVAVLWTEIGGMDAVVVAIHHEQADEPVGHEQAIVALADSLRPQVGDVLHMGAFTVPAQLSEEEALTEIEGRLARLLDA